MAACELDVAAIVLVGFDAGISVRFKFLMVDVRGSGLDCCDCMGLTWLTGLGGLGLQEQVIHKFNAHHKL